MYVFTMLSWRRFLLLLASGAFVLGLAACGSGDDADAVTTAAADESTAAAVDDGEGAAAATADDGEDDDHGDEDHDDHGDDDHGDEHHDDEDHDEHGDEDHDDHGDEDHDDHDEDKDHDDHGEDKDHDDHGDEDDDDHDHDDTSGGFDAHEHGAAELFVAWSGSEVVVDLISPAINIVGFEYEPATDEDKATLADSIETLSQGAVPVFNDAASCSLDGDVEPEFEVEGSHAEIATSWTFTCENPDEINELDATQLFEEFPGLLDVDVQWASDSQQSAAELTPTSTVLRFE